MRILFVIPYTPSLIRVRSYQLIRTLAQRGHAITLATLWASEEEEALGHVGQWCEHVVAQHLSRVRAIGNSVRALATSAPLQAAYCWHPALARDIRLLLQRTTFDVVHVEHLRGARYGLAAKAALAEQSPAAPVVWDSVDCISHLFHQATEHSRTLQARLMSQLDLARTRHYEGWLVRQFDRVVVTSAPDRQALLNLAPLQTNVQPPDDLNERVQVVANGVDLDYFAPRQCAPSEADVVFTGKMSYHANVSAALFLAQEIMPQVWAEAPAARLWIVGKEPPSEIRQLAAANGGHSHIVVTGEVPDMRPYLHRATVAVAPLLYGAGIQNKLLEAMAVGVPVIATPQAVAGLKTQARQCLVVAAGAEAFAQAIVRLLNDPAQRAVNGECGRRYVEAHHAWSTAASQLEAIYCEVSAGKQRAMHAQRL